MSIILPTVSEFVNNFMYFIPAGLVTGFVLSLIYLIQRIINKSNIIDILQNEISRNIDCIQKTMPNEIIHPIKDKTSSNVYCGLLSSGNIKYFKSDVQAQLNKLYDQFSTNSSEFDDVILNNVTKELKYMRCHLRYWRMCFFVHRWRK